MEELQKNIEQSTDSRIDELEADLLSKYHPVVCPLVHRFVPGMYIREIHMPAGAKITSLKHNTMHPFFILKGKVSVFSDTLGEELLEAPYTGITVPGTRRVLYIHEDCVWATCHATNIQPKDESDEAILEAVNLIGQQIIEPHENKLLGGIIKNNVLTKSIENETELH